MDKAQSAGFLVFAASTGRALLLLRSSSSRHPGTWGIPGGRRERGEELLQAAHREFMEEVGVECPLVVGATAVQSGRYVTFLATTPREFVPRLNWEHSHFCWAELYALPGPLHKGVAQVITLPPADLRRCLLY